jgi:hypothetical protein
LNLPLDIDGRYPAAKVPVFNASDMRVSFQAMPFATVIRVDDVRNPDFWMELKLTRSDLQALLERMR